MAADILGLLEAALARSLRDVDRACMIAVYYQKILGQADPPPSIERAFKVRAAIEASGILLPELRAFGQTQDAERSEDARERDRFEATFLLNLGEGLTTRQIANLTGENRITIMKRARRLGGAIWRKYQAASRKGKAAIFTPSEVRVLLFGSDGLVK